MPRSPLNPRILDCRTSILRIESNTVKSDEDSGSVSYTAVKRGRSSDILVLLRFAAVQSANVPGTAGGNDRTVQRPTQLIHYAVIGARRRRARAVHPSHLHHHARTASDARTHYAGTCRYRNWFNYHSVYATKTPAPSHNGSRRTLTAGRVIQKPVKPFICTPLASPTLCRGDAVSIIAIYLTCSRI